MGLPGRSKSDLIDQRRLPPFKVLATYAGYVLAIYGAIALLFPAMDWAYRKVSLGDAAAIARPFCERYVFPVPDSAAPRLSDDWRLVGISLWSTSRLEGARFQLSGLKHVLVWHVHSDDLSAAERTALAASLPVGSTAGPVVSSPLPVLRDEAKVSLAAVALVTSDDTCWNPDSLTVTAINGHVYTLDPRRAPLWAFMIPPWLLVVGGLAVAVSGAYVLLGWLGRRKRATVG